MTKKNLLNKLGKEPLIIAEVGQNHQGSLKIAKDYIREFSYSGADIIKFQARDNRKLFSKWFKFTTFCFSDMNLELNSIYTSRSNSFN